MQAASTSPLVSAIIIFLDEQPFLAEAVASVLNQTYTEWELLLIDDGSSDGSSAIAKRAAQRRPDRVRYFDHPDHENRGMSASRNLGLAQARGDLIAFLDGDDVWLPGKLAHQVAILTSRPEVELVCGDTELWFSWTGDQRDGSRDCSRGIPAAAGSIMTPPELMRRCFPLGPRPSPATCSLLARRSLVDRVGGYETAFRGMFEDQAFLAKLYLNATVFVSGECLDRYRIHAESCVSRSTRAGRNEEATYLFLKWLGAYLRRHAVSDAAIWKAYRKAVRRYRYASLHDVWNRVVRLLSSVKHQSRRLTSRVVRFVGRRSTGTLALSPNPVRTSDRFGAGTACLSWHASRARCVEVRVNRPDGPVLARGGPVGKVETAAWVTDGMSFYLQDVTEGRPLTVAHTLDVARATVVPEVMARALSSAEMPPEGRRR